MPVVLDTGQFPAGERAEAFSSALNAATFPAHADLHLDVPEPSARIQQWALGPGIDVVHAVTTGHTLRRTARQIRGGSVDQLSLALTLSGSLAATQGDRQYTSGNICSIESLTPYEGTFHPADRDLNVSLCAQLNLTTLGLPVDIVRAAAPRLKQSPLYPLFQSHLRGLASAAASVEGTPAAALLGSATSELARALLSSATPDDRWVTEGLSAVLWTRIDAYIQENLGDHGLDARQIAAHHSISLRYLYRLSAERGVSLEQEIIRRRLEHARRELASPTRVNRAIESIAFQAGFSHPQHFSRRFRQAYGVTPSEWRRIHSQARARDH